MHRCLRALLALALLACEAPMERPQTPESSGAVSEVVVPTPPEPPGYEPSLEAPADVAAPPADAERLPSGLASRVLIEGTSSEGPQSERDRVTVHYTGWTTDGERFDSSRERGESSTFPLNGVIAGWTEGVQLMRVGEHRRFWIPEDLAYPGRPGRPAGMLVFDVELIGVEPAPAAPPVPIDVAAVPPTATTTSSGLASRVLQAGTGTAHPTPTDRVEVHYTGWQTNGEMFDSSVTRGRPATFPLNRVIAGWTEGVQLMVVGETRRLWIPESLAYQGRPGAPQGMLVFDVELLAINP
ncbi:MAG: FKBP-type peptidyl-prolyl cis-trans isomerase [Myxococcota bacterium]